MTPVDIHNKEFKTALRGYNRDDVNNFLDQVIHAFEILLRGEGIPKLTPEEIAKHKFRVEMRGYHRDEVNQYIDQIIDSYEGILQQSASQELAFEEDPPGQSHIPASLPQAYPGNHQRITPEEIHSHQFLHAPHGYDIQGVNQFLDRIIHDYAEVLAENRELSERLRQYERPFGR
ncbi:DivIVA domain-containing protein [Marininema mesophilum]|uniref:DivIVA domain-containing protein n=1 Tax=Marininema mesophilum TaxID=1048340 RepID=A0A1H2X6A6_9BACL|nr:DivIVA domain-containing protein [Marininema mesophilum]SDW88286.1 DivIVA domain-containing protein [Marininema mesophilum]